jgi:hypothetical protein
MHSNFTNALLGALVGFVIGGIVTDAVASVTQALISSGSLGAMLGASLGGIRNADIPRWGAVGGGIGLIFGLVLLLANLIVGG